MFVKYGYIIKTKEIQKQNTVINKNMKNWFGIITGLAILLAAGFTCAKDRINIYEQPRDLPTKQIISTATGNKVSLEDFAGNFVIAVFWSKHCTPCVRELKDLARFAAKTKNDGIRVIMISPKSEWIGGFEEQRRFMLRFEAHNLETYVDEREAMASAFGIFSSPVSIFISSDNKEIGRIRGSLDWNTSEVIEYIQKIKDENG